MLSYLIACVILVIALFCGAMSFFAGTMSDNILEAKKAVTAGAWICGVSILTWAILTYCHFGLGMN